MTKIISQRDFKITFMEFTYYVVKNGDGYRGFTYAFPKLNIEFSDSIESIYEEVERKIKIINEIGVSEAI